MGLRSIAVPIRKPPHRSHRRSLLGTQAGRTSAETMKNPLPARAVGRSRTAFTASLPALR